ncbi:c-type cytochrome [Paraburkholderia tropica]|uniref:c-type cytochrome n=1 Tax=Paraburkholderia tropica TaxID=92647 RepID=UPI001591D54F|nr:cytochrome c [Paraburkholderia tropica]
MRLKFFHTAAIVLASLAIATSSFAASEGANDAQSATAESADAALITKGRYLATAADCAACHTAQGGKPFSGGYPISSPLGTIYSTNITPSIQNGIGEYSEADFSNALRKGIRRDGKHLYPAMPYTSYAQLTDDDVHALYVYFHNSVEAVNSKPPVTALPFPFNLRLAMVFWNTLYLSDTPYRPDPTESKLVNRGAYLANALEHCAACHTPRDVMMGPESSLPLAGGSLGSWYAPNITSDKVAGIGGWSDAELVQYLKTGSVPGKAQAAGPMAEAITHSLQYLSDDDLSAIVAYLRQTKPINDSGEPIPRFDHGAPLDESSMRGSKVAAQRGWQVFSGSCAACHQANGGGLDNHDYPSLYHNSATGASNPDNLIATILFGLQRQSGNTTTFMPAFGSSASFTDQLSDKDVADVSNFVLHQFGNANVTVTEEQVADVRKGGKPALLARVGHYAVPAVLVLLVLIVALGIFWLRKKKTH